MKKPKVFRPKNKSAAFKGARTFNGRSAIDRMYDSDWEAFRRLFLAHNPFCYACANPANAVDHLVPHQGDLELFWKSDNFLPLCDRCHNTITSLFDRYHRPGKSIDRKLAWIANQRLFKEVTLRVRVVTPQRKLS